MDDVEAAEAVPVGWPGHRRDRSIVGARQLHRIVGHRRVEDETQAGHDAAGEHRLMGCSLGTGRTRTSGSALRWPRSGREAAGKVPRSEECRGQPRPGKAVWTEPGSVPIRTAARCAGSTAAIQPALTQRGGDSAGCRRGGLRRVRARTSRKQRMDGFGRVIRSGRGISGQDAGWICRARPVGGALGLDIWPAIRIRHPL